MIHIINLKFLHKYLNIDLMLSFNKGFAFINVYKNLVFFAILFLTILLNIRYILGNDKFNKYPYVFIIEMFGFDDAIGLHRTLRCRTPIIQHPLQESSCIL